MPSCAIPDDYSMRSQRLAGIHSRERIISSVPRLANCRSRGPSLRIVRLYAGDCTFSHHTLSKECLQWLKFSKSRSDARSGNHRLNRFCIATYPTFPASMGSEPCQRHPHAQKQKSISLDEAMASQSWAKRVEGRWLDGWTERLGFCDEEGGLTLSVS